MLKPKLTDSDEQIYAYLYREISKCFQYILKHLDDHIKLMEREKEQKLTDPDFNSLESDIIETIVKLGKTTQDQMTSLNAATCLAYISEILHCNPLVASHEAIDFMIQMLKDAKNLKHYR